MQTQNRTQKHGVIWLRFGLVLVLVLGVMSFFLANETEPVEAAEQVSLNGGDTLIVRRRGCALSTARVRKTSMKIVCRAFTPTPTNTATETATATATATETATATPTSTDTPPIIAPIADAVSNEDASGAAESADATLRRLLRAGDKLQVLANGCTLQVKVNTESQVKVFCKTNPTPTATRTTAAPKATVYVRNATNGQVCYEVLGSGIGNKCFSGGDSLYGSFTPGVYSWVASGPCGQANGSFNFTATTWLFTYACQSPSLPTGGISSVTSSDLKLVVPGQ